MNGFIIFSDLKGFSKLTEPEIRVFYKEVIPSLTQKISKHMTQAKVLNTWGDAIVAIFENGREAVEFALDYKSFFKEANFKKIGITKLLPRVACHFGEFEIFEDPIIGMNILGTNINATARIEPVTRAGEIYVSKPFKEAIERLPEKLESVRFDELGVIPLAKNFGEMEIYRLYSNVDKAQIVDLILKTDLSWALPKAPEITESEQHVIDFYRKTPNPEKLQRFLKDENITDNSGEFIIKLADVCKSYGLYTEAIHYINHTEKISLDVNGIKVYPYKHNKELLKLKANCLTRVGRFEEAADIVYGLWQFGMRDSDTLSMLAAQYKRRALFNGEKFSIENINTDLLNRSKDLYLEAFRINIEDFYPAINVAYLYKMLGGLEGGKGTKLANYILNAWEDKVGDNWWLDSTLAEAELLLDDFGESINKFKLALDLHKPDFFERQAVAEQISIYAKVTNKINEVNDILILLGN